MKIINKVFLGTLLASTSGFSGVVEEVVTEGSIHGAGAVVGGVTAGVAGGVVGYGVSEIKIGSKMGAEVCKNNEILLEAFGKEPMHTFRINETFTKIRSSLFSDTHNAWLWSSNLDEAFMTAEEKANNKAFRSALVDARKLIGNTADPEALAKVLARIEQARQMAPKAFIADALAPEKMLKGVMAPELSENVLKAIGKDSQIIGKLADQKSNIVKRYAGRAGVVGAVFGAILAHQMIHSQECELPIVKDVADGLEKVGRKVTGQ